MNLLEELNAYENEILRQLIRLFPHTYTEIEGLKLLTLYKEPMKLIGSCFSPKTWAYRLHSYQENEYLPEQWLQDINQSQKAGRPI
ncbi:hypothetical protein CN918_31525 [Priestia megaterium]|nr:hypothetical protein CN918_31525 [Priestia megaterium]